MLFCVIYSVLDIV